MDITDPFFWLAIGIPFAWLAWRSAPILWRDDKFIAWLERFAPLSFLHKLAFFSDRFSKRREKALRDQQYEEEEASYRSIQAKIAALPQGYAYELVDSIDILQPANEGWELHERYFFNSRLEFEKGNILRYWPTDGTKIERFQISTVFDPEHALETLKNVELVEHEGGAGGFTNLYQGIDANGNVQRWLKSYSL